MKTETKKKIQEVVEEKTTVHHCKDADRAEQSFVMTTMKGEPGKISNISSEITISTNVSRKQKQFTKPQQDYRSMGIRNQVNTDSTGNPTNGRGVCDKTGPPGQ